MSHKFIRHFGGKKHRPKVSDPLHNPNFKGVEFDTFRKQAGLNNFNLTPKKWIETTNAVGIVSKSGRYGGTYAHKDLAFEFAAWISQLLYDRRVVIN